MKKIAVLCLLSAFVLLFGANLRAQSINVNKKPGAVSVQELQMNAYPIAPDAHAVYLVYNETMDMQALTRENKYSGFGIHKDVQDYFTIATKHYMRLKVLDEAGLERANMEFTLLRNKPLPDIYRGLKVTTYNLVNGKAVATKMDKSAVSQTKLNSATDVVRFTAPDVKVGSVIEVQWETLVDAGLEMPQQLMQKDLPINYGEFTFNIPAPVYYTFNLSGMDAIMCERFHDEKGAVNVERYVVRNMPAFVTEPFCESPAKYMARATYNLQSITYAETYEKNMYHTVNKPGRTVIFNQSWAEIDKALYGSDVVKSMQGECRFAAQVDAIVAAAKSEEQIIADIRSMVLENVKWNGVIALAPDASVVTGGGREGTNADINALVAACLNRAGFVVCPVFLKLRSSGAISGIAAEQFDTFIVYAENKKKFVFDAADPAAYINVIPKDMISDKLRFVNNSLEGQWLDLGELSSNIENHVVQATLQDDGTLKVMANIKFSGEKSYTFKQYYQSFGSHEEFVQNFAGKFEGYTLKSCEVSGADKWSDNAEVKMCLSRKVQASEDGAVEVSPFICDFFDASVLRSESRRFPIEFTCSEALKYNFVISLGDSYELVNIPESYKLYNREMGSVASQMCNAPLRTTCSLLYTYSREKNFAPSSLYPQIRAFWMDVCNGCDGKITIKKK